MESEDSDDSCAARDLFDPQDGCDSTNDTTPQPDIAVQQTLSALSQACAGSAAKSLAEASNNVYEALGFCAQGRAKSKQASYLKTPSWYRKVKAHFFSI